MNDRPDPRQRAFPPLASHSFARVLTASLLVALAIPRFVVVASYPAVAVAFLAGLLAMAGRHRVAAALEAGEQCSAGVQHRDAAARRKVGLAPDPLDCTTDSPFCGRQ